MDCESWPTMNMCTALGPSRPHPHPVAVVCTAPESSGASCRRVPQMMYNCHITRTRLPHDPNRTGRATRHPGAGTRAVARTHSLPARRHRCPFLSPAPARRRPYCGGYSSGDRKASSLRWARVVRTVGESAWAWVLEHGQVQVQVSALGRPGARPGATVSFQAAERVLRRSGVRGGGLGLGRHQAGG